MQDSWQGVARGAGATPQETKPQTLPHTPHTLQGYLTAVGLCLGPDGGPRGGGRFLMSEVPLFTLN